jgi:hypothetical protein
VNYSFLFIPLSSLITYRKSSKFCRKDNLVIDKTIYKNKKTGGNYMYDALIENIIKGSVILFILLTFILPGIINPYSKK